MKCNYCRKKEAVFKADDEKQFCEGCYFSMGDRISMMRCVKCGTEMKIYQRKHDGVVIWLCWGCSHEELYGGVQR